MATSPISTCCSGSVAVEKPRSRRSRCSSSKRGRKASALSRKSGRWAQRFVDLRIGLRRSARSARPNLIGETRRGPEHSAGVTQQVRPFHRRPRARHRQSGLQEHSRLWQRTGSGGAAHFSISQGNQFILADLAVELLLVERWIDYVAELVDGGDSRFRHGGPLSRKLRGQRSRHGKMATECVQFPTRLWLLPGTTAPKG